MTELDDVRGEYRGLAKGNRAAFDSFARRVTILLAALAVFQLGLGVLAVKLTIANADRANENKALIVQQKGARARSILLSCEEANTRHDVAAGFVAALVAKGPKAATPAARKKQAESIAIFDEAIAPQYVAGHGTLAQRRAAGCNARLAEFSKP